jgi:hypothetical protein
MKNFKLLMVVLLLGVINGCVATQTRTIKLPSAYALPGTSTAVVGIAVAKTGIPLETVKEVVLKPGQKVIFAGPDRFLISFKNQKFPEKVRYESGNGVVTITIPKDILERPEYREEYAKNKFVRFDYAINVNGKELDPPMIIRRDE